MDNDILEQIYHRYAGQVYLYLFSLCHSHALAEDLMQETFLKALCSMELSQDAVLPWLLRVAKNLYIDAWRKQRHHTEAKKEQKSSEEELLNCLIHKEQNRRLYQAIQALRAPEREAVVLYYFAGLSQADIARQLGMSHGNVRVMLHRAKQRLRNLLED